MTDDPVELPCHRCGYDLRAHRDDDGQCPECGASVAEARQEAEFPRRPAWRDSDPRWRRRILAGLWILTLMPLMEVLDALGWTARLPAPRIVDVYGMVRSLDDTLIGDGWVWPPVTFCVGAVLLFSTERRRRRGRLDWTRRWGVGCSYVVALLSAASVLMLIALVAAGIAAIFQSIALKYQPPVTQLFVNLSTAYLRYGALPANWAAGVVVAFSSVTMLLACAPLYEALRGSGLKRVGIILLAPLALLALMHTAQAAWYCMGWSTQMWPDMFRYGVYFAPQSLRPPFGLPLWVGQSDFVTFVEATKWCIVFTIAVCLSVAQIAARRQRVTRRA